MDIEFLKAEHARLSATRQRSSLGHGHGHGHDISLHPTGDAFVAPKARPYRRQRRESADA
jgi:hypothetical protein